MFKKIAADALGLSDIGSVIKPVDYDKVDADDYVMNEDNEKIYFLIKSKADEYCFTNLGLIHLDGTSALSKKRTLRRFNYSHHPISNVALETAGTVDLDVEIKFLIGTASYSIDVHKKHIAEVKDLYKSLLKIAEISEENETTLQYAKESIHLASTTLNRSVKEGGNIVEQFKEVTEAAFFWMVETHKQYKVKDYGHIFERYINQ
ncbi:YvbH-like oligomerisation region [Paenibacillus sp. 1_12]|uniref:PH domain-containing protein n=1 Tax=Paenibacillus sp. 1_12 TaxID=1566278 RepID=UPI0008F35B50|nr:PH domain-containing protein [Paenibacillus sp. 1_12]SFM14630.1 YvbH-like oligomerisation region [Paenibacillus sp. 1_12]